MDKNLDTLSEAVNALTIKGYIEGFVAEEKSIKGVNNKKEYQPKDLKIVEVYRFEGMTDPADQSDLFAVIANDGVKGTLVMSNSADHSQNVELIRQIEIINE
jgi:hypothetical protein